MRGSNLIIDPARLRLVAEHGDAGVLYDLLGSLAETCVELEARAVAEGAGTSGLMAKVCISKVTDAVIDTRTALEDVVKAVAAALAAERGEPVCHGVEKEADHA